MSYIELLQKQEWYEKCNTILNRDKYTCQDCGCRGFHNNTFYVTDSIEEVDEILNRKVLIGDVFSELFEQTKNGYTECDKVELDHKKYSTLQINERRKGKVIWESYKDVEIDLKKIYDKIRIYDLWLYKENGFFFSDFWELSSSTLLITENIYESLNFELHRYKKYIEYPSGKCFCPTAILKFPEILSEHYMFAINNNSISLTFKNYVFYVDLDQLNPVYKGLNVHHKYYKEGHKPWEYEDSALITLCEDCHKKRHEKNIPYYQNNGVKHYCKQCDRCGGKGYIQQYYHVENGICFKCGGEGALLPDI